MERHGPPEDLGQLFRCDSFDQRQDERGGVRRIHHADVGQDDCRIQARARFPKPINSVDRMVDRLAGAGLIFLSQSEGDEGPGANTFALAANRGGDPPRTHRIDAGQTTTHPQCAAD